MNNFNYSRSGSFKSLDFFAEFGDVDFHITIDFIPEEGVEVTTASCGRDRSSIWTDPETVPVRGGYWEAAQEEIRRWGGKGAIWPTRIGQKEYW